MDVHLCTKRQRHRHAAFAQALRRHGAPYWKPFCNKAKLPSPQSPSKRNETLKMTCTSEIFIFYYYENIFFLSCHSSLGISSLEWTLKVLLIYQVLIGHDIKHTHLL